MENDNPEDDAADPRHYDASGNIHMNGVIPSLESRDDFDPDVMAELRASVPRPYPRTAAGVPMGNGIGGRVPRYTDPLPSMFPNDLGSPMESDPMPLSDREYRRLRRGVSGRARYRKPSLRDRLAWKVVEWTIQYMEDKLDEAYDLKHELMRRLGILDLPDLAACAPLELDDEPLVSTGAGIFRGGIGTVR